MDTKARSIAFHTVMNLSCERGCRELTKDEHLLHIQACKTLQLFLIQAENDCRIDQDMIHDMQIEVDHIIDDEKK